MIALWSVRTRFIATAAILLIAMATAPAPFAA
ncbi:hypothetical protein GGD89_003673 [Roseospira visakhapatnamensis]|uniref:Uncharacterized protein n=1 Tax=Roseospira visakhapatnamensis TaxID=390880 RepID=A0A7W6RHA5_9PROT|nr:hypothetical protein [Roseospira visakhapatnamensis]